MLKNEKIVAFFIAFIILGTVMGMQGKSILREKMLLEKSTYKTEELRTLIAEEKSNEEKLKAQIDENEKKSEKYLKASAEQQNDNVMKQQVEYLESLKLKAGLTDVKGRGVVIKLNDALTRVSENPNDSIVHDGDVIKVLNELKSSGCQAISVNDERVVATSEQICTGTTIRINKKKYITPFIIRAIGDPDAMYEKLEKSEIVYAMREAKIRVEISKSEDVTIPKYKSNINNLVTGLEVIN